jgi:alpha-1,3-rhamnosyl/mannosyltransferase
MVANLGLAPERIDVTYQAPRAQFRPATPAQVTATLHALALPPSFFLYVGTLEPRKNIAGLLTAYAALPSALRQTHPLVLAGGIGWKMEALSDEIQRLGIRPALRLLGYLGDEVLAALYTTATAFVWPTFYEGFGLPPLEAMACGCPVITSAVASLPEVVGDAGILLDPCDTRVWADAMRRMAEDAGWRADWAVRGSQRAGQFSWPCCARQTLACYRAALREA